MPGQECSHSFNLIPSISSLLLTKKSNLFFAAGREPPSCIHSFDECQLLSEVRNNVTKAKYDRPTPVQKYGIPIINGGRDLMACAQTGSGKTVSN